MKKLIVLLVFCTGCPKTANTLEKQEREEAIKELIDDEEIFEDLPESTGGEDDEDL